MNKQIGVLCALMLASSVSAKALQMDDFAYGIPLQVDGDGAIYSLALPAEVYQRTTDAGLADLRVFNSHGEEVPHLLQRAASERQLTPRRITAPLYPLPTQSNRPASEELHIAIGEDGTLIDFYGGNLPLAGAGAGEYYLLDASAAAAPVERMLLQWDAVAGPLLAQVSVYGSDDLNHWQPLVEKRTIAALHHQGFVLEQHSINLPGSRSKYYRIHWPPGSKGVPLKKVELALQPQQVAMQQQQTILHPQGEESREGDYRFDLGGHFPISGVQLIMPQRNSVAQVRLFSRSTEDEPWQLRHRGLFYDLEREGHSLRNEPVSLPALTHALWRLEVLPSGGGLGSGQPQLQLGWYPQRLLFVARGEMPFTLAFGRSEAESNRIAIDPLLMRINREEAQVGMIKPASAGAWFELGGAQRLQPAPPPLPWQKWLLWGVLLLGVAVLGVMVRSLYRQMVRDNT